jgi:protein disulfide-isomerase
MFWKTLCLTMSVFFLATGCSDAATKPVEKAESKAKATWTEDIEEAFKTAAKEKKLVFINFTGSDWCFWCKIADKNIFQTAQWAEFSKRFVCLKVDFPRAGAPDVMTMQKRRDFAKRFSVRGYPTFVLADADKMQKGRFSAGKKSAEVFIGEIEAALKNANR